MNKADIKRRLANTQLDDHERESLSQLLHYMIAEGVNTINNTSSSKGAHAKRTNNTRSKKKNSTATRANKQHKR